MKIINLKKISFFDEYLFEFVAGTKLKNMQFLLLKQRIFRLWNKRLSSLVSLQLN